MSSRPSSRDPGQPYARYCIALSPCHRHPRLRPPGFAYAPIGLRFGNPCKHGCAHLAPIVHIKCGMTVLSHRCTIVCAIVIPANASQGAGSAAGMTVLSHRLCCRHHGRSCTQRLYHVLSIACRTAVRAVCRGWHYASASASASGLLAAATPARLASTSS